MITLLVVEIIIQIASYQRNKRMDAPTVKKPMHERAWGRHHVGVFLRLLFNFLLPSELRPILAGSLLLQSLAMGGRIELCRLLQDPRLRGTTGGSISTDRQGFTGHLPRFDRSDQLEVREQVLSGEEAAWDCSTHIRCCLLKVSAWTRCKCQDNRNVLPCPVQRRVSALYARLTQMRSPEPG